MPDGCRQPKPAFSLVLIDDWGGEPDEFDRTPEERLRAAVKVLGRRFAFTVKEAVPVASGQRATVLECQCGKSPEELAREMAVRMQEESAKAAKRPSTLRQTRRLTDDS